MYELLQNAKIKLQYYKSYFKNYLVLHSRIDTLIRLICFIVILGIILFFLKDKLIKFPEPEVSQIVNDVVNKIESQVNVGGADDEPLKAKTDSPQSFLTIEGVVKYTNQHRIQNGLAELQVNEKLNASAMVKAQDMFKRLYFEHESPEGIGVDDLVQDQEYSYILVGENLALGNFINDSVLVQGWMESPGHRANILKSDYKEIGVAVLKGIYQGRSTWMAVQHFGRPISDCPQPDSGLKNRIDANEKLLAMKATELNQLKTELETTSPSDPSYNQKVNDYNAKVSEYNALVETTKGMINEYNTHINNFNQCAGST